MFIIIYALEKIPKAMKKFSKVNIDYRYQFIFNGESTINVKKFYI